MTWKTSTSTAKKGRGSLAAAVSLGKKLTLAPATQLLNLDIVCDLCYRAKLKNSLWLTVFPDEITFGKKKTNLNLSSIKSSGGFLNLEGRNPSGSASDYQSLVYSHMHISCSSRDKQTEANR